MNNMGQYMPPKPPAPKDAIGAVNAQVKQANHTFLPPFLANAVDSIVDLIKPPF